jgi:hypothetical protein
MPVLRGRGPGVRHCKQEKRREQDSHHARTLPAGGASAASGAGSESSRPDMMCRRLMNDTPFTLLDSPKRVLSMNGIDGSD